MRKLPVIATSLLLCTPLAVAAGPDAGDRSFTLSGTGSSDQNFDGNSFGVSGELGYYANEHLMYGVRQSINGTAGDEVSDSWNGSTRLFADYHFGDSAFRPFVGASVGGLYGENVQNTGTAGVEAGFKYYVLEKTFINFGAEYAFLFNGSDDIDNSYDDGAFFYNVGVGYNF